MPRPNFKNMSPSEIVRWYLACFIRDWKYMSPTDRKLKYASIWGIANSYGIILRDPKDIDVTEVLIPPSEPMINGKKISEIKNDEVIKTFLDE